MHFNQEHSCCVMTVSAGERDGRCKVSVTEPIKICSSRTTDRTSRPPYNQPLALSWCQATSRETQVALVCVFSWIYLRMLQPAGWELWPIQEIIYRNSSNIFNVWMFDERNSIYIFRITVLPVLRIFLFHSCLLISWVWAYLMLHMHLFSHNAA